MQLLFLVRLLPPSSIAGLVGMRTKPNHLRFLQPPPRPHVRLLPPNSFLVGMRTYPNRLRFLQPPPRPHVRLLPPNSCLVGMRTKPNHLRFLQPPPRPHVRLLPPNSFLVVMRTSPNRLRSLQPPPRLQRGRNQPSNLRLSLPRYLLNYPMTASYSLTYQT